LDDAILHIVLVLLEAVEEQVRFIEEKRTALARAFMPSPDFIDVNSSFFSVGGIADEID